ncbi:hypothetical protein L484_003764 [Morus notabilis]|uniref:Uncharacterized protein n=1 Tax=Morus notabilis TaxID=981085 RepID=W9SEW7_9ROSA|nr:hypothetical protein L484_003764 [Morus notabilis]
MFAKGWPEDPSSRLQGIRTGVIEQQPASTSRPIVLNTKEKDEDEYGDIHEEPVVAQRPRHRRVPLATSSG